VRITIILNDMRRKKRSFCTSFLMLSATLCASTYGFSQKCPEFRLVQHRVEHEQACQAALDGRNFALAYSELKIAEQSCRDTSLYAIQIADLLRLNGDTVGMIAYLELALANGRTIDEVTGTASPFREVSQRLSCVALDRLYTSYLQALEAKPSWQAEHDLLGQTDQWVRACRAPRFSLDLILTYDSLNYQRLATLTKQVGRMIPGPGTYFVLIHTLDKEVEYDFFGPYLDQGLIDGDIDSGTYALIVDGYLSKAGKAQLYGTDAVFDHELHSLPIIRFNAARSCIGLPPFP